MTGLSSDVWDVMSTARTIRRFTDEPVDNAVLARCLQAATWAPSGANAQRGRCVVPQSAEQRAVVAIAVPNAAPGAPPQTSRSAKAALSGTININTASATDLQALPGVGARTAALIVEYRQKNGPFKKVEDLMNVRGIGEKNILKLKPQITFASKTDKDAQ